MNFWQRQAYYSAHRKPERPREIPWWVVALALLLFVHGLDYALSRI
jgi:hypothetical protein